MKTTRHKWLLFILTMLLSFAASAQEFIGCRTDSGWAETPMLRKTFVLANSDFSPQISEKLTFYLTVQSIGYYEIFFNGQRVDDEVLPPAVSQLTKRVFERIYDVTDYMRVGDNELMLWIGQGWGRIYGIPAAVNAELESYESDGHHGFAQTFANTDSTWDASPSGYSYTGSWQPLQFGGERFDARIKPQWRQAAVVPVGNIKVVKPEFNGNRIVNMVEPQRVDTLSDGTFLLDFGRVLTGWFQADMLPIPEGDEITMEYLDDLNSTYSEKDLYVSDGTGDDDIHFTNRFHMHAFRYVKVRGLGHYLTYGLDCPIITARALQISAVDPQEGATFWCNDERLNAIHDMVKYTLSTLTFSGYMVDCPHLERMGYGGDGNSSTNTLQTLWDVRDTYLNWLSAWGDAMEPDGELPYVAPAYRTGGGPYWSGFIIKAPWNTYVNYGDRTLIFRYSDYMLRWLKYIEKHSEDEILQPWPDSERHTWFLGDWLAPEGVDVGGESVLHVNSCFISDCLADMIKIDSVEGFCFFRNELSDRRQRLNAAIHRHFYHPETHTYANGTPLDQAYALLMGIPPDSATAAKVKAQLLKDCHEKYRDHIAVGLVGVPVFTEWCIRERQTDLMATLLRQPDYPGYLHMINNGATTTWESWNGDRSRVHNCYNGIGIWFYQALAGIRPDPEQPGYKHFFIDPQPCKGVNWVKCTKPTSFGDIKVEIKDSKMTVTVPEGTTATLFPDTPREQTLASGEHIIAL